MTACEICGKNTDEVLRASVEGTAMNVCKNCSSFGEVMHMPKKVEVKTGATKPEFEEVDEVIVRDYPKIIRIARGKLGLTQAEFAKKINEKESLMKSVEGGKMVPNTKLARKLEKTFHIKLIEEFSGSKEIKKSESSETATLGDLIKIKERKK